MLLSGMNLILLRDKDLNVWPINDWENDKRIILNNVKYLNLSIYQI